MSTYTVDRLDTWHFWHHCSWGMSNRRSPGYSLLDSRRMLGSHYRLCRFGDSMSTVSACCQSHTWLCHHMAGSTVPLRCLLLQSLVRTGHMCNHKGPLQPCWCCRWGQTGLERQTSWRKLPGLGRVEQGSSEARLEKEQELWRSSLRLSDRDLQTQ